MAELKDWENNTVARPISLTRDDLIAHIKNVGQAIINDAEQIALDPQNIQGVSIIASIEPLSSITTVDYSITRIADPRREYGVNHG